MADSSEPPPPDATFGETDQGPSPTDYAEPDGLLRFFVILANIGALETGILIILSGATISGTLVSGKAYLEALSTTLRQATLGNEQAARKVAEDVEPWIAGYQRLGDDSTPTLDYEVVHMHLRDAQVLAPGQIPMPSVAGRWMRIRLTDVAAWSMGGPTAIQ